MSVTQSFIEMVRSGKNCLLTGGGGVGKTYTINKMKEELPGLRLITTATTGLASLHVGGCTIHSFSNMGIHNSVDEIKQVMKGDRWYRATERIRSFNTVIIDEISMMANDQFDLLDLIFRKATKNESLPFGGKQIILVGDFLQLPPVIRERERKEAMDYKWWVFNSKAYEESDFKVFHLTEVKRQSEMDTIKALNEVRFGRVGPLTNALFSSREGAELDSNNDVIRLMPTNKEVDKINMSTLAELEGEPIELKGTFKYNERIEDSKDRASIYYQIIRNCTAPEIISLKKNARVILLKNNPEEGYVNGSMGTLLDHGWFLNPDSSTKYDYAEDHFVKDGIEYERVFDLKYSDKMYYLGHLKITYEGRKKMALMNKYEDWKPQESLVVKLDNGRIVLVARAQFPYRTGDYICDVTGDVEDDAIFYQFPVRLAWAITIHKSQGMTLDNVEIHMNRVFAEGQAYVALSRAKSLWGMRLLGWKPQKVMAEPNAVDFYNNLMINDPEDEIKRIREGLE